MIKYIEFQAHTNLGKHIQVVGDDLSNHSLIKTAGLNYAPEIMDFIKTMNRKPGNVYVAVNALGADESWGCNTQGDAFPRSALNHISLRSDMQTPNDYGYKTFEYYGHLYKHHVNKDPKRSYGRVIFSHWNANMDRVELIVEVYSANKDIIEQIENGEVAVSMGCKIARDRCSICGNLRGQGNPPCVHVQKHLKEIADESTAKKWSLETGKVILPGAQVKTYNDTPRFFDISIVYVGADRTAFILGKVASDRGMLVPSFAVPESLGLDDAWFEKIAYGITSKTAMDKEIDGSKEKIDGKILGKLKESLNNACDVVYDEEESIPHSLLDSISSTFDPRKVISTLMSLGIVPKPQEFQRIVLIAMKKPEEAALFGDTDVVTSASAGLKIKPEMADETFGEQHFSPELAEMLSRLIPKRSMFHGNFLSKMSSALEKKAEDKVVEPVSSGLKGIAGLLGLAALYAVFKARAEKLSPDVVGNAIKKAPYLKALFLGSPLLISHQISQVQAKASEGLGGFQIDPDPLYKNAGIEKTAAPMWQAAGIGALSIPAYYTMRAHNRNREAAGMAPVAGTEKISRSPILGGALTAGSVLAAAKFSPKLIGALKK